MFQRIYHCAAAANFTSEKYRGNSIYVRRPLDVTQSLSCNRNERIARIWNVCVARARPVQMRDDENMSVEQRKGKDFRIEAAPKHNWIMFLTTTRSLVTEPMRAQKNDERPVAAATTRRTASVPPGH